MYEQATQEYIIIYTNKATVTQHILHRIYVATTVSTQPIMFLNPLHVMQNSQKVYNY